MSRVKTSNTQPELKLRSALHQAGLRFRLHRKDLPGTPDVAFIKARVAVFVDGDFWHGRLWFEDGRAPERNREAWVRKFERNRARDQHVGWELVTMGWASLRFWESEVNEKLDKVVSIVKNAVLLNKPAHDDAKTGFFCPKCGAVHTPGVMACQGCQPEIWADAMTWEQHGA